MSFLTNWYVALSTYCIQNTKFSNLNHTSLLPVLIIIGLPLLFIIHHFLIFELYSSTFIVKSVWVRYSLNGVLHLVWYCACIALFLYARSTHFLMMALGAFTSYVVFTTQIWVYQINLHWLLAVSAGLWCVYLGNQKWLYNIIFIVLHLAIFFWLDETLMSITSITLDVHPELALLPIINVIFPFVIFVIATLAFLFSNTDWFFNIYTLNQMLVSTKSKFNLITKLELHRSMRVFNKRNKLDNNGCVNTLKLGLHAAKSTNTLSLNIENKQVGVIFLDLVDSSDLIKSDSQKSVSGLCFVSELFNYYDELIAPVGGVRIKTNGDQYIAVVDAMHSSKTLPLSLTKQLGCSDKLNTADLTMLACNLLAQANMYPTRIAGAYGNVWLGKFNPKYNQLDIWGETVLRAARLEKKAMANQLIIDGALFDNANTECIVLIKKTAFLKGLGEIVFYVKNGRTC